MTDETKPSEREALVMHEAVRAALQRVVFEGLHCGVSLIPSEALRNALRDADKVLRLAAAPAPSAQPLTEKRVRAMWVDGWGAY